MENNMVSLTFVTAMYSNNAEVTSEYDFKVPESWAREYYEKHKEQFSVFWLISIMPMRSFAISASGLR